MASDYVPVLIFMIVGIGFSIVALLLAWLIRPHHPFGDKELTYECGEIPTGDAWRQFRAGFYVFTLAFVIFDVEALFIIPWALALREMKSFGLGLMAAVDGIVFLVILAIGLLYAWKKGALQWE